MTDGERKLWFLLRRKQLGGFRFRRQAAIGPYIADFFCPKARLIVELDAESGVMESGRDGWRRMAVAWSGSGISMCSNALTKWLT